jgi:hypothetical protein
MPTEDEFDPAADKIGSFHIEENQQENVVADVPTNPDDNTPLLTDVGWSDYVLSKFHEDELNQDGFPAVDGLRRVAQLLIGEIVFSEPTVLQCPNPQNDGRAVVKFTVVFDTNPQKTFSDVADVYPGNTPKKEFSVHATATASTKAEGRALRKALNLRKVLAAEEVSDTPIEEPGKINSGQISFMNLMCERNNIDAMKLIGLSPKLKGVKLEDIPYAAAVKINAFLTECQNGKRVIPEEIKGYKSNWRPE